MISLALLPDAVVAALTAHATAAYPREACGVVFHRNYRLPPTYETFACRNAHRDPGHHFRVGVRDRVEIALRVKAGDHLVAIYHSHCDQPAVFSDEDRAYAAAWPDALHLVLAVTDRGVLAMHAYTAAGVCLDEPVMEPA